MSKPPAGNYFIVSKAISPFGLLALNFTGENNDVIVTSFQNSPTQVWVVSDYGDGMTQSVSPQTATNLQIGMGDGVLKTLPANAYVWYIRESENAYTVQDDAQTVFWSLQVPVVGVPVSFGPGTGSQNQNWGLIPA